MEVKKEENVTKVDLQEIADQKNAEQDKVHKVDMRAFPQTSEEAIETEVEEVTTAEAEVTAEVEADVEETNEDEPLTEITAEEEAEVEEKAFELEEALGEQAATGKDLPENIQKLVDFITDTGGSLEDYVALNRDVSQLDENQLLKEFHKKQEPDLTSEEIDFLMEDLYAVDEFAEEREQKKKSIAKKRAISQAKKTIEDNKTKYYDEIKAGSKLTPDQKKAIDFFGRYEKDQGELKKRVSKSNQIFQQKTEKVFGDEFKGFEFKVGEKRFRYNVKDVQGTKDKQASIDNFTKEYLGDDNVINDAKGYHKALFTAMNSDAVAEHFYKQGQADAIKNSVKNKKNINMGPRKDHSSAPVPSSGFKARVVDGDSVKPGKLRIKNN